MTSPLVEQIKTAIEQALPGADVEVIPHQSAHFSISVAASQFEGQSKLACQRSVYRAIAPFMDGTPPPVHAIDRLQTRVP